jgi:hypothetical protein
MKEKINDKICNWLKTFGGSPSRFTNVMFNNYEEWKILELNDIKYILENTKYCGICQYAFIPFFIKYVGVDLRPLYLTMGKENCWDKKKIEQNLTAFPKDFISIHSSSIDDYYNYQVSRPYCLEIRKKLIHNGIKSINKLKITDKNEWLHFPVI